MEEDIKILELTLEDSKDYGQYCLTRTELDAIENLISALHKANKEKHNQKNLRRFNERKYRKALSDYRQLLKRYKELEEENKRLKEYIFVAPNLDEMTAVKYSHIQRDGYIRGRAEEQEKVKQIIYENYIPISVIQNKKRELEEERSNKLTKNDGWDEYREYAIEVLEDILEKGNK